MQRRAPINIRRIDRTLVLQHQPNNRHIAHRSRAMQRQLSALILDPSRSLVREQFARCVEIRLRSREVQSRLAIVGLGVDVGVLAQQEIHEGIAILDARGDHQCRPSGAILRVDIEPFAFGE